VEFLKGEKKKLPRERKVGEHPRNALSSCREEEKRRGQQPLLKRKGRKEKLSRRAVSWAQKKACPSVFLPPSSSA